MPDYASESSFGYIRGVNADFATAKSTSQGSGTDAVVFGEYSGQTRLIRGYIKFDTSGIPDTATITQVNFKAAFSNIDTDPSDTVVLAKYNWSGQDPITAANREAAYDGALAATVDGTWVSTSGKSINTYYTSDNLDTTWVNKTGSTYYAILSKTYDIDGTGWVTGAVNHAIYIPGHATYPPVLIVTYTTGGALRRINMSSTQQLNGGANG